MNFGRTVSIYLPDGSPSGVRRVQITNWSGQAIACPRSRMNELVEWKDEAARPGVYFLLEKQTSDIGNKAYIGESEDVLTRLGQHDKSKDFWNEVIIFTSKDDNLTKGHVKYLESRLTAISLAADRYTLENANNPTQSLLPRGERDAMDEFLHYVNIVLGTLGHRILEPVKVVTTKIPVPERPSISSITFRFVMRYTATGQQTDDGFVVFAGSQTSLLISNSAPKKVQSLRENYIEEGILVKEVDCHRFTKDVVFSSSSYAASMIAGTSRSGPQSWLSEDGRSLAIVEEQLLKAS